MKKLIPIMFFLICGCLYGDYDRHHGPAIIRNAYFTDVYFRTLIVDKMDKNLGLMIQDEFIVIGEDGVDRFSHRPYWEDGKLRFTQNPDWDACGIGCGISRYLIQTRGDDCEPLKIWVFQDIKRKCLLYAYTREELIELKKEAGFSIEDRDPVFLLERTGIRVVSHKEYMKLKPTLEPHRYDPSLCKPKPAWPRLKTIYMPGANAD